MATNQLLRPADLLHSFPKTDPLNRWQVHGTTDAMVPMRDGVRLATDIWRPAHGDGSPVSFPVPVLLVRTSYDKQNPEWDDVIPYLVRRGIAVAIQDVRSRYRSEGDGTYYHNLFVVSRQQSSNTNLFGGRGQQGSNSSASQRPPPPAQTPPRLIRAESLDTLLGRANSKLRLC